MQYVKELNSQKVKGYSYAEFILWMGKLVKEGKTTGVNQDKSLVEFTALNLKRMQRIDKTLQVEERLFQPFKNLGTNQKWIVITEGWCGDSAQTLPLIHKIAEILGDKVSLKIILRDKNPEWIAMYPTKGSRSIPKLISFDGEGKEQFTWGPRPHAAQQLLLDWKANKSSAGKSWEEFEIDLHTWYTKDKGKTIQNEFVELQIAQNKEFQTSKAA